MPRRSRIHLDGVPLHAYVLMANHVHLLVTPTKAEAAPKFIISLGRRYVQYINRSYRRAYAAPVEVEANGPGSNRN